MNWHSQFLLQPLAKRRFLAGSIAMLLSPWGVSYSQFVPGPNPISAPVVTAQTLSSGTGEVTSTGSVTVGGGMNSITLGTAIGQTYSMSNSGILNQTGTGRALRNNVNNSNITIINFATGLIRSNNGDTFQIAQPGTSIALQNSGQIISLNSDNTGGDQAIDWGAIATGANSLPTSPRVLSGPMPPMRFALDATALLRTSA